MATQRQLEACRQNGRLGGPKTAAGKAVSRLNARKHGIFASALTVEDAGELKGLHEELAAWLAPVGAVEEMLVEKLAQTYLCMQRCSRAEAEWHLMVWEESIEPLPEGSPGYWFDFDWFGRMVALFGRYDQTLTNQFIKLLHEIERVQRLRGGEDVPPPIAAEVNLEMEGPSCGTAALGCDRPAKEPMAETPTAGGGCATQACETSQIDLKSLEGKGIEEPPAEVGPLEPSVPPAAASGQATGTTGRAGVRPSDRPAEEAAGEASTAEGGPSTSLRAVRPSNGCATQADPAKRTKRVPTDSLPMSYRQGRRGQMFFQKEATQRE